MAARTQINNVNVDISVILGRCRIPMQQLLRMGRGAVIPLDAGEFEPVWILANNYPIARGEISISGEKLSVVVTDPADVQAYSAAD